MTLEQIIQKAFNAVQETYCHPPLNGPQIINEKIDANGEGTALLNWLTRSISINAPFVEKLAVCAAPEEIARGLLTHEFGHYYFSPRTLPLKLYLSYQAVKTFREKGHPISTLYFELANNLLVAQHDLHRKELTAALQATWDTGMKTPLDAAIFSRYAQEMALTVAFDFPKERQQQVRAVSEELSNLVITPEVNYNLQLSQMLRFGQAILPLLEGAAASGNCRSNSAITPTQIDELPPELQQKVEEELKKLIPHIPKKLYHELRRHFLPQEERPPVPSRGIGTAHADMSVAEQETIDYYREAAKQYGIYIRPKRARADSSVSMVFGRKEFRPGGSLQGMDTKYSGGKIIDGLTTVPRTEKIPYPGEKELIPSLVLYKDASGSMLNPADGTCYGTIAGGIFLLSYLRSGAAAGVALFDSETSAVTYSRNEDELLKIICGYKGGGTAVDMERLKSDLKARKEMAFPLRDFPFREEEIMNHPLLRSYIRKRAFVRVPEKTRNLTDFVIVTDGGIANLEELITFFRENQEYRPTILYTGGFTLDIPGYDGRSGLYEGIQVYKADTVEDIIAMSRKAVRERLLR